MSFLLGSGLIFTKTELERKIKLLNLKIVDFETRSMTSSPRSQQNRNNLSVIEPKQYEEVLNQLEQEKENYNKLSKKAERSLKDLEFKLVDSDRSKNRLLDEIQNFENKLFSLRKLNSDLVESTFFLCGNERRSSILFLSYSSSYALHFLVYRYSPFVAIFGD
jgi:Skp family chaperone for outer membrane proteins